MSDVAAPQYTHGFAPGLDESTYHADPCPIPSMSSSIAKTLWAKSPAHAYQSHPKLGGVPWSSTKSQDAGTITHRLLLGKGADYRSLDFDNYRTKASKEARDAARAEGAVPVLGHELDALKHSARAITNRLADDFGIVIDTTPENVELSVFWQESGAQCRGRFDMFHRTDREIVITDLKTTKCAHPRELARTIDTLGYDIQRGAYVSAVETLLPEYIGRVRYQWIFVELDAPHCVTPALETEALAVLGRDKWRQSVSQWVDCLNNDRWPGYVTAPVRVHPTPWAMNAFYENEGDNGNAQL